jgi:hypothetical protein
MTDWSFNIDEAPRGKTVTVTKTVRGEQREVEETRREYILAVHADGTVDQSYWIPPRHTQSGAVLDGNRWSGFNVGRDPIAWAPWPVFEFRAKAGEEAVSTMPAVSNDPVSRTDDVRERQHASTVEIADDCRQGGNEQAAAASVPDLITHKHIFLEDCGSGA